MDLLTALEDTSLPLPGVTEQDIDHARAAVSKHMGWE